jgi:hypothetical protein
MQIIFFLGRNTENIMRDAYPFTKDWYRHVIVVTRDDEKLEAPPAPEWADSYKVLPVGKFKAIVGERYLLIANGGTSTQLIPVFARCLNTYCVTQVLDVQPERTKVIWENGVKYFLDE